MSKAPRILNVNIGILGHVDSGKTTLTKAISTHLSTASLDKNSQSQQRGITLDLGFSAFFADLPYHLRDAPYDQVQFTLVDCPGHASLIKTIIGGAQIIDMMLLVVDATKGIQTQTAECIVIGEILSDNMIVVLNKTDLLENPEKQIKALRKSLQATFVKTKFGSDIPMVAVSANPGGTATLKRDASDKKEDKKDVPCGDLSAGKLQDLLDTILMRVALPDRDNPGSFYYAIDHCFPIKGRGTVMTGTVLDGAVALNQTIEIPSLKQNLVVKSMQMFHRPVERAQKGDRVAICVTKLDAKQLERGVACEPGTVGTITTAIAAVEKIKFHRDKVKSKAKFHVTIGHSTTMATCEFFDVQQGEKPCSGGVFDWERHYAHSDLCFPTNLKHPAGTQFAVLQFEHPITCQLGAKLIGSRLDSDNAKIRLAFHGRLLEGVDWTDMGVREKLKIFKTKERTGNVDRVHNDSTLICKALFSKETDLSLFAGMKVQLESGETGKIESSFGKGGKFKVYFADGFPKQLALTGSEKAEGKGKKKQQLKSKVFLRFRKYMYAQNKKDMVQT